MTRANEDVRQAAKARDVPLWKIAEKLGIYDGNLSRKLRHELPDKEKTVILGLIEQIAEEADRDGRGED